MDPPELEVLARQVFASYAERDVTRLRAMVHPLCMWHVSDPDLRPLYIGKEGIVALLSDLDRLRPGAHVVCDAVDVEDESTAVVTGRAVSGEQGDEEVQWKFSVRFHWDGGLVRSVRPV